MARNLLCLVLGHKYTDERVYSPDEAQLSACKRCGRKRYARPTDTPPGFFPG